MYINSLKLFFYFQENLAYGLKREQQELLQKVMFASFLGSEILFF